MSTCPVVMRIGKHVSWFFVRSWLVFYTCSAFKKPFGNYR